MRFKLAVTALALLAGCAGPRAVTSAPAPTIEVAPTPQAPTQVGIIAFNDFHGALEPPNTAVPATTADGREVRVPAGGAAWFASAIRAARARHPNSITVSAGDLISASPLVSANFLDEPTILAMNMIGLDINATGNHEFDRGRQELLRMQNGGCAQHTARQPCRLDPDFPGGRFRFLAANVRERDGTTLFPAYEIRTFGTGAGQVRIAFIGLPLHETASYVTPAGVAGLTFEDEANTINALVPRVRAEGADAVVVIIHQGLSTRVGYDDHSCAGIDGDLLPILARLDPSISLVVSGHTHNAYVCNYGQVDASRPFLVTSAGRSGTLYTDITMSIDPATRRVTALTADNHIVQSVAYGSGDRRVETTDAFPRYEPAPDVAALVQRYAAASAPIAGRIVGHLTGPALRERAPSGESVLGNLIADAHLAATRGADAGGAQLALTNAGGVRADLAPGADGAITYGQIFTVQPFGNTLTVLSLTGAQLQAVLEQQFNSGANSVTQPNMLMVSRNFTYGYDLRRPAGQRIIEMRLDGRPVRADATYRVTVNSFMATGGDNFTLFREGTNPTGGMLDIDALERYLTASGRLTPPRADRIRRLSPPS